MDQGIKGMYCNSLNVGFNAFEFVLDFGQRYPSPETPQLCVRIVTTPAYAQSFVEVLSKAIADYEATSGPIPKAPAEDCGDE